MVRREQKNTVMKVIGKKKDSFQSRGEMVGGLNTIPLNPVPISTTLDRHFLFHSESRKSVTLLVQLKKGMFGPHRFYPS